MRNSSCQAALGSLPKKVITEHKGSHRLDHGYGSGQDAGVMSATALELSVRSGVADSCLLHHDGRGRFKSDFEKDRFPV